MPFAWRRYRMEAKVYTEMRDLFTVYLREKKLRKTEERYKIFEYICTFPGHFDMCMLSLKSEESDFHISKATLYNTVEVLVDAGLVVRHQVNTKFVQYELRILADTHIHLICTKCGIIREMEDNLLKKEVDSLKISRFTPEFYCLYVYGLCSKCKFRMQRLMK